MTYAPTTLTALGTYWVAQGGVNLGIVGDTAHAAKGTSYHLGRSQLLPGAYSRQTPRDVAGLSEAASAIDLGRLDGTLTNLQTFSRWLVDRCRHNATGTRDLREIIYSPDGLHVLRWDRERGYASAPVSEGDDSHRTHTHLSYYRDAEYRDKRPVFRPYFEDAMPAFDIIDPKPYTLVVTGAGHLILALDDLAIRDPIADGTSKAGHARIRLHAPIDAAPGDRRTGWLVQHTIDGLSRASFLLAVDVTATAVPEYTQVDIDNAVDANEAKWERWVASHP